MSGKTMFLSFFPFRLCRTFTIIYKKKMFPFYKINRKILAMADIGSCFATRREIFWKLRVEYSIYDDFNHCKRFFFLPGKKISEFAGKADVIIAADGGANLCAEYGIKPTLIIGDFDSISDSTKGHFQDVKQIYIQEQESTI